MPESMAQRIRQLRLEKGLTLEQVAEVVGVGKSTVRKWETGMIANMRRDKIAALAIALGTTPAYLMGWKEENEGYFDYVSLSNEAQTQLYGIFEASIKKHDTTDGFAAAHSDLKKNILLRLKEKRMSMASRAELLYLARFLEVSEEADPLIRKLPKLEEPYSSMYRQFHEKNVIKIAGRDGSYKERTLTDEQLSALNAFLDVLPDASDDL